MIIIIPQITQGNFSKIRTKIFQYFLNIISFSCRGRQALAPEMRTMVLLSIMKKLEFLVALQTGGQTNGPTQSPRHDSNNI